MRISDWSSDVGSSELLGEVVRQMGIDSGDERLLTRQVIAGGPVHPERGFVIHDGEHGWDSSLEIADRLNVTTSRDVLEAMARGEGPESATVALGCAGRGAGQPERELVENSWLTAPADPELLFALPPEAHWHAAAGRFGCGRGGAGDFASTACGPER